MCFFSDQQRAIFEDETFQIRIHELGLEKTSTNKLIKQRLSKPVVQWLEVREDHRRWGYHRRLWIIKVL